MNFKKKVYCDLNIPVGPQCKDVCEEAIKYGYKILALNTPIVAKDYISNEKKKGKKRKLEERTGGTLASTAYSIKIESDNKKEGLPVPLKASWISKLEEDDKNVKIYHRITIIFTEINDLQILLTSNSAVVKQYDIIGIVPTNHDALQASIISTCITFDIISFDFEGPYWINKIRLNKLKGNLAAEKQIFFEITYSSSLHGNEPLENVLFIGNRLTEDICTKKIKNIIISSGAASPAEIRSTKDTTHFGFLLGLDETTTRLSIREHSLRLVDKIESRKFGKTWVAFIPSDDVPEMTSGNPHPPTLTNT